LLTSRIRNVSTGFVTPDTFDMRLKNNRETNIITLTGLYFKYNKFKDNATINGKLTYSNGKFYDKYVNGVWQNPYETKQTFAMTPAIKSYKGFNLQVKIPSNIFYSNYQNVIQSIQIDFDNGQGYVNIPFNQNVAINYTNEGTKTWKYKLTLSDNTVLYNQSLIKIEEGLNTIPFGGNHAQNTQNGTNTFTLYSHSITATTPYAGQYASVNLTIDDTNNDGIKKPLIVAEGFDLGVVLEPENINGNFDYEDFKDYLLYGGIELRNLIYNSNKEYDIIYVDWNNGVDYMQRNAYALQEVIKWVNQQKTNNGSTEPNVVLGQSMGGVISRYALADMEENNLNHDTRLFISHDAPQQGANLPVSIQFMYRHLTNQYIQTNTTLFGGIVTVPILENNFGVSEYLSLLDAPASRQLVKNFSTLNYSIDNSIHTSFYNELKSKGVSGSVGYPVNSRNIAISNGSECGTTQDFNAGDHLVNYQWDKGLSFWGDLASLIYNPLGGTIGGLFLDEDFFGVAILGMIPGQSKYNVDFNAKSIPYGSGNQIYKGKISYTKKILWLFNVTVNITDVQKNQPNGVLPFDSYGGGFFNTNTIGSTPVSNLYIRDKFSFIPTTSALDIGENNVTLYNNDYLRAYVGANPPTAPKNSPFINFSTEFDKYNDNAHNKQHISFNSRNGDWLASELIGTDIETTDCSAFCSNAMIYGRWDLCSSRTFSVTSVATSVTWWLSEGADLVTTSINGNEITLTVNNNNNPNSNIVLNATYSSPKCGSVTVSKTINVGKPTYPTTQMSGDDSVYAGQYRTYSVPVAEGATGYHWYFDYGATTSDDGNPANGWEIQSGQGTRNISVKIGSINSSVIVVCRASNICGNTIKYLYVTVGGNGGGGGGGSEPCQGTLKVSSNPMESGSSTNKIIWVPDPCDDGGLERTNNTQYFSIEIYDRYYQKVYSQKQHNPEFELKNLKHGFYIVKYQTKHGSTLTEKILVK